MTDSATTRTAAQTDAGPESLEHGRKLEEWIVSTIDDRGRVTTESDWLTSIERFSLAKRPVAHHKPTATVPTTPTGWARFRLSRRKGVTVATLTDQALIREDDLAELTGDLLALIEAGHRRLVLDFQGVERLSSWASSAIAETVVLCKKGAGGTVSVKVCGLKAGVATIFAVSGVALDAGVEPDVNAAVSGFWAELPEFRPLPVSILAALLQAEEFRPALVSLEKPLAMNHDCVRLIAQDGPKMGRSISIKVARFVIGRGSSCHLRVSSAMVSRSHAAIERRGARVILRDLASTNGLLLNGRPLRAGEAEVHHGDRIQVGPMAFVLDIGPGREQDHNHNHDRDREPARTLVSSGLAASSTSRGLRTIARPESSETIDVTTATEETLTFDGFGLGDEFELKYEVIEGVLVVTPMADKLDGDLAIDALRDALHALFDRKLPSRVVVSLAHVGHLSSRAIGVLVAHHLRLDRVGGALRVCLASPRVTLVLDQVRLAMLVDCHQSIDEAVISAWPA